VILRSNRIACTLLAALAALAGSCTRVADRNYIAESMHTGSYSPARTTSDSLVVGSYNIQYGENIDQAIIDLHSDPMIESSDILLLQEMGPGGTERIAEEFGFDFVYYAATLHPEHDRPFGNAVLSRAPILQHYFIALPVASPFPVTSRIAVVAQIDTWPEPVVAVSVHTSTVMVERSVRLEQYDSLRDSLMRFEGPTIIGGDFNTPSYEDVRLLRARMREEGFLHVRPTAPTAHLPWWYAPMNFEGLLDHLFYRRMALRRNGVVEDATASDHVPIWAVFGWDTDHEGE
jgi:endonuclease/exonuclease/phosphatase family metal-dependent hydrolase